MKTYRIIITNEASNYTSTKYNNTLNGFTSEEAASKAAKQALRDAAGELMKWDTICYIETLNAWVLANNGNWLLVAKIEATETEQPETKQLTVKRSDWNETAKRLECAGWYYIGTPTATGKTIYRRDNSELEIIIEEEPTNTPSTMNANETISAAIIAELNTRKDRSAWDKGVTEYATELAESLDNWDKQPESVAELREMMLNGADDWKAYSWGGSSLIYNQDIAERLCSPSELKRVTNKNGLRDYPNSREHWLDVQARALYQAATRVAAIAEKLFNA